MKRYRLGIIKFIGMLIVLALYFFMAYAMLWDIGALHILDEWMRRKALVVISIMYCVVMLALLVWLEALAVGRRRILDLIFGFFFSSLCVNILAAILVRIFAGPAIPLLIGMVIVYVLVQSVIGLVWILVCHKFYEHYQFRKEALFVYGSREDEGEYVRVNNTINRYFTISRSMHYAQGEEKICAEIEDREENVVVYIGDIPAEVRNRILKFCMKQGIDCYSIPKISDIYVQNAQVMQLNDKLLLRYPPLGIEGGARLAKRLMDVVLSLILIGCTSPIMLVVSILIRAEDGGPVLYRQERVTKDGAAFQMIKFRSMCIGAEEDGARLAAQNDARVTKIGRRIRNLHFDELPQLVNVLRGEMSLVGPRPERREFIEEYSERIPEFGERLKVKGGLTGYAQIYGRYNTEPEDKIKYDLYYIYNYSLWLDFKLIILTIRILSQKENTQGITEGQRSALRERPAENRHE